MIETKLTRMLGIQHPIISSGVMRVSTAELVASVANAGALGFLTALTQPTPEELVREIERTREAGTSVACGRGLLTGRITG